MLTWRGSRRIGGLHDPDRVWPQRRGRDPQFLERAVKPAKLVGLGDALAALGRKVGLTDEDIAAIAPSRGMTV